MQLNQPSQLFVNVINDCRFALKKLGNPQVRHNFREGNIVGHILETEGCQRDTTTALQFLMEPPTWIKESLENYYIGRYVSRKINMLFSNYLSKFGNLSVLNARVKVN